MCAEISSSYLNLPCNICIGINLSSIDEQHVAMHHILFPNRKEEAESDNHSDSSTDRD